MKSPPATTATASRSRLTGSVSARVVQSPSSTASDAQTTTRERYESLHAQPGTPCGNCHAAFDPIGFGFEHYDETGRYREQEFGFPVDSSGSIPGTSPLITFGTQEELVASLAELPEVHACVSGNLKTFAFGVEEACLGETQRQAFINGEIGFLDYLASLAAEPHLVARRAE